MTHRLVTTDIESIYLGIILYTRGYNLVHTSVQNWVNTRSHILGQIGAHPRRHAEGDYIEYIREYSLGGRRVHI